MDTIYILYRKNPMKICREKSTPQNKVTSHQPTFSAHQNYAGIFLNALLPFFLFWKNQMASCKAYIFFNSVAKTVKSAFCIVIHQKQNYICKIEIKSDNIVHIFIKPLFQSGDIFKFHSVKCFYNKVK